MYASAGIGVTCAAVVGAVLRRTYFAFDIVISEVMNSTVEVVKAVDHGGSSAANHVIPAFAGCAVVLLLLFVHAMMQRYWVKK